MKMRNTSVCGLALVACLLSAPALAGGGDGPVPMGESNVRLSYQTSDGEEVRQSNVDYSGRGPGDVIPLGGDPRFGYFNSVNAFGRRGLIDGAVHEGESLLAHALFKGMPRSEDFFADMVEGSDIVLEVTNIQFDEIVYFEEDTFMMHMLWDADQVDLLDEPYVNLHDHNTEAENFREFEDFFPLVFTDRPVPNYALGAMAGRVEYFGEGTDTLGFRVTVPYSMLMNFEEMGQEVPDGLPAPFGFLEPFHFHYEFVVSRVPEPATAMLLLAGLPIVIRRRR